MAWNARTAAAGAEGGREEFQPAEEHVLGAAIEPELKALDAVATQTIALEEFVPASAVDPLWVEKSYYLEPEKSGAKPYALLRQALQDADRMAVVTVAPARSPSPTRCRRRAAAYSRGVMPTCFLNNRCK